MCFKNDIYRDVSGLVNTISVVKQVSPVSVWTGTINTHLSISGHFPEDKSVSKVAKAVTCSSLSTITASTSVSTGVTAVCSHQLLRQNPLEPLVSANIFNLSAFRCHDQLRGFRWSCWTDLVKTKRLSGTKTEKTHVAHVLVHDTHLIMIHLKADVIGGRSWPDNTVATQVQFFVESRCCSLLLE